MGHTGSFKGILVIFYILTMSVHFFFIILKDYGGWGDGLYPTEQSAIDIEHICYKIVYNV